MPVYIFAILIAGWVAWCTPFVLAAGKRPSSRADALDRRARWGVILQALSYALIWQGLKPMEPPVWRIALSVLFLAAASAFSWSGTRALGRQWRVDAGLNADHELVRSGPYAIVRHPIYASMLFLLLGTGFMVATWLMFAISLAIFIVGTEIRTRVEDALLETRFGDEFRGYRRSVPAYIPFVRASTN